jgi:chlorosome envelope protein F
MANENNGVFSDLFNAVGTPVQNVADLLVSGVSTATSLVQSCCGLCVTIVSNTANATIDTLQSVLTGISSAIAPKK